MKLSKERLKLLIKEELRQIFKENIVDDSSVGTSTKDVAGSYTDSLDALDVLKSKAKVISPRNLVPSEEAIRLIKKHEGFRKRIYDDKWATNESTGPWITSFGWDPITGEMIPPDPISGRLGFGGKKFDITSFDSPYPPRMSKTNGVATVGYGFALNNPDKIRKWSKHLGGQGPAYKPVFGGAEAGPEGESSSTMSEKRDMTEAEADKILKEMLPRYYEIMKKKVRVPITQAQFDGLVSRAWNEGQGGHTITSAILLLNNDTGESWEAAASAGKFNSGTARNNAEKAKMLKWKSV